jgi:hypothetical protein
MKNKILFRIMSPGAFGRVFSTSVNTVFRRFFLALIRASLIYLISLLFVELPTFWRYMTTLGKDDNKVVKQKRVRAKITDDSDPSSPYRAVEVLDELQTQPEDDVETLAVIPDLCLQRHPDKETLGVRQILDVEDEIQPNGKVFKKVFIFIFIKNKKMQYFSKSSFWVNINLQHIVNLVLELMLLVVVYYQSVRSKAIEY